MELPAAPTGYRTSTGTEQNLNIVLTSPHHQSRGLESHCVLSDLSVVGRDERMNGNKFARLSKNFSHPISFLSIC